MAVSFYKQEKKRTWIVTSVFFVRKFKIDKSDHYVTSNFCSTCTPRAQKIFHSNLPLVIISYPGQVLACSFNDQFSWQMIFLKEKVLAQKENLLAPDSTFLSPKTAFAIMVKLGWQVYNDSWHSWQLHISHFLLHLHFQAS